MNTGGPAFPVPVDGATDGRTHDAGMTLLDWYAGQETIGDEELSAGICDHFAGPRPSGDWKTNPVGWYEWEARWRAGVKYTRATAMLAEKARREATDKDSLTVADHSPDATKMIELQAANRELAEALADLVELIEVDLLEQGFESSPSAQSSIEHSKAIISQHKGAA